MCKKQTAVPHSSTESEIISLDTGLRLDGLLALELRDLIVSVLGNISRVSDRSGQPDNDVHKRHKSQKKIDVMKDIDAVLSNVQSARQEALLYVFEDNEAVIKMIMKGRSPTIRHVSRTHRVALDWLFDRINLDSKIQIKYIDTKNQLADILTKGNFTRDEWNHLLNLFNISHFSSTACTAAMAKRAQQGSGEERVTAKSRPMMKLTARMPSVVSSSTSSNPVRTSYGYQDPGKSVLSDDRSGKPEKTSWDKLHQVAPHREEPLLDGNAHSVRYRETIHDGSGKPENLNHQEEADSETFVMGNDAAEFVDKVKDQVRNRQKRMSNVAESGEEHSIIWGMFMAATMNAATFMGKNFSTIQSFIKNYKDLTLKQMFDVTAQLVNDQEEIHGLDKIHWEKDSWKRLSLIGDETVINLQSTKVYVFSDYVLCLGRILQHPDSNEAWKNRIAGVKSVRSYRDYDGINGEPTEFEWNIFPGFTTLQLCGKINDLLSDLGQTPETFTGRILFMSMFNDISCDRKGNKDECLANAGVVKVLARRFGVGQWSFIGPGSEKKWYSAEENSPQGAWGNIAEEMLLEFAESGHPTFRATTPLSRGQFKSKGHGKLSIHFTADYSTIETIFRIIISVNQLSIYGAAICEEFENHQDGSVEPEILMGQSIVLGEIKAEVPLQNENPLNHQILCQQYIERIESLSPESKVSRFCMEAGFMRIVEVGQYFMTKDTGDFRQIRSVTCREYTLPRDDPASQPKGWIQGNMRIGSVLEVTTSFFKTSHMDLKFESGLWVKTILNLGSEYLMERSNMWSIQIKTIQKFLQIHKKIKCHKQVSRLLQPDQRQKQNHNRENLLIQQLPYRCTKKDGLTLSHQNKLSLRAKSRRK